MKSQVLLGDLVKCGGDDAEDEVELVKDVTGVDIDKVVLPLPGHKVGESLVLSRISTMHPIS